MERTEFFGRYRICQKDDALQVRNRTGPAVNYDALDTRTSEKVVLQLIPRAMVDQIIGEQFEERIQRVAKLDHVNIARVFRIERDDDYLGLVSEHVEGETAESWVVTHGPMPAEAVLRVALQVVRALGAAAYHGLSHRALEPANIMIVRGQSADGGWPLVKLLDFGLAGLAIYDERVDGKQPGPAPAPQFASPEQLVGKPIDFRSEMYSLGAAICFLLTGAVPLAASGMKARLRARRLPELRRAPRALRNLLVHMLRENPENRPQDPVLFEKEIQNCLATIERWQALGRKLGLPLAAVVPRRPRSTSARSTTSPGASITAQVIRGVIAFAALVLIGGIVAAFFLPEDVIPFRNRGADEEIGVPVGVPNASEIATTNSPSPSPSPPAIASNANTPEPPPAMSPTPAPPETIAQAAQTPPPPPPAEEAAETPNDSDSAADNSVAQNTVDREAPIEPNDSAADATTLPTPAKKKTAANTTSTSSRRTTSSSASSGRAPSNDEPPSRRPGVHARFLGTTPDGRRVLRLPSGRTVAVRPGYPDQDVDLGGRARRRTYAPRDLDTPYQPFDAGGPRD